MCAGVGAVRDAIAIDIKVSAKALSHCFKVFSAQYLAAVVAVVIVKFQRRGHPFVHAQIQVAHDDHGRLQPLGEIKCLNRHAEALSRCGGEKQYMFGVAMRRVGRSQNI